MKKEKEKRKKKEEYYGHLTIFPFSLNYKNFRILLRYIDMIKKWLTFIMAKLYIKKYERIFCD